MKRTTLTNHINAFRSEMLMILRFQLAFNRIIKSIDFTKISRSNFVDQLIALKTIENDLLIRICKFDDNTKGVHSFPKAMLELNSNHPNKEKIIKEVEIFKKYVTPLKRNRRHTKLAHLKIGEIDDDYEARFNFTHIIEIMVSIIDLMIESRINYTWNDGKYEKFDLRDEIFINN